jgi:sterol 24-C-methyltransferase
LLPFKISKTFEDKMSNSGVAPAIREYERRFKAAKSDPSEAKERDYTKYNDLYYNLVTDFYLYGWGRSFHFAPRVPGESLKASIARHQHYMANILGLRPGMVVADLGCGVGGPLLEIARFSGAKVVGVNSNAYQIERARKFSEESGLTHLAEFMHGDFLAVDAPDESFDAVYAIEALCHAPDKVSIYREVYRLLKPGAHFGSYEWVMTDRFDAQNPLHVELKEDVELGGGMVDLDNRLTIDAALRTVGFEVLETRDLAVQAGPSVPWYQPLAGSGVSLASFRSSRIGRWVTTNTLRVLEALRIAPEGSVHVQETLAIGAVALAEAGRLGIFTPMYFMHARKPA